ncbi:MAG: hypothetical protein HQ475_12960 [SAR202 cluster bacterium]|nr:hypothetical protein [SAR202 cluster bacterium]
MTIKLIILAALAVSLFAFPVGNGPVQAQQTTDVHGKVVNGTEGAELPGDLSVLMLITGADGRLAGTGQADLDADGQFVFKNVEVLDEGSYAISVDHLGVFYGTSLAADNLADDLVVTVYETTKDASIIRVEQQVMVIAGVDKDKQQVSAIEFVRIFNPSDRTLLPDLTNFDQISFLRFALPPGANDLTVQSDLPGGDISSIGTGFALTSPVIPGAHSIDFSYIFPYDVETVSYRQSLVQGADVFQVLVPEKIPGMAILALTNVDPVNIQGTSYRAYEGRNFPPGQGLQLEITGLPLPGVWARFSNSVTSGAFWQIAIPSALGITLAVILLWGLIRGYRPDSANDDQPMPSKGLNPAERAAVVQAVAALDQQFQDGGLPETEYGSQRQELMARVLNPDADLAGASQSEQIE